MEGLLIYIIFFHILSAVVWIGGMIAIRLAVHPALLNITDEHVRLARVLEITGRLFMLVLPFIIILVATGLMMAYTFGYNGHTTLSTLVHVKETIWLVMTLNYALMVWLRFKAQDAFLKSNALMAKKFLAPIPKYMLPLNIFLGMVAIFLGLVLRGL